MYVLGIETSCDETASAVVKDGREVISDTISSSLEFHQKYGGIVPEIAFRRQLETIAQVVDCTVKEAGIKLRDIAVVAVTEQPGLLGSLVVGLSFAKGISMAAQVPLLGVNHLQSHIYSVFLNQQKINFPFVALVVSGGHSSLFYIEDFREIRLLGETLDDACGEAFDKVAQILGLGYPGGPLIERLAQEGDAGKIKFACSRTKKPLDFSFSGIKTAVLYYVRQLTGSPVNRLKNRQTAKLPNRQTRDIAASFQETIIDTLLEKSLLACKVKKTKALVVGGGVSANNRLRQKFLEVTTEEGISCFFPEKKFCTDNAAMVAGLGYWLFKGGR